MNNFKPSRFAARRLTAAAVLSAAVWLGTGWAVPQLIVPARAADTGDAKPAPAAKPAAPPKLDSLENGYLIVGTYLIHLQALTTANWGAAQRTIADSGQGVFYKSEFADGAWFDIQNAVDLQGITKTKKAKLVDPKQLAALKIYVWIDKDGNVVNLYPPDVMSKELASLQKEKSRLEEDNKKAVEDGKSAESAKIALQIQDTENQIAFLEQLASGNGQAAAAQLAKLSDPNGALAAAQKSKQEIRDDLTKQKAKLEADRQDALAKGEAAKAQELKAAIAKLDEQLAAVREDDAEKSAADPKKQLEALQTEKASKLLELQNARTAGDDAGVGELQAELVALNAQAAALAQAAGLPAAPPAATPEQAKQALAAEEAKQRDAFAKALQSGDAAALAQAAAKLAAAVQASARAAAGLAEQQAQLGEAKAALEQSLAAAQAAGDAELAGQYSELLDALQAQAAELDKQALFTDRDAVAALEQSFEAEQPEAANALEQQRVQAILEIQAMEKKQYTPEELAELDLLSEQLSGEQGGGPQTIEPLPVEHIVSRSSDVKFAFPPVLIDGTAYIHIRPISESFGAQVLWNEDEQSVLLSKDGMLVYCRIDDPTAYINGDPIELDTPPRLLEGRTVVPLRLVMESLGLDVTWDAGTRTIDVETKP